VNKNFYGIVFNRARGMRVVVHEAATSTGKGASKATSITTGVLAGAAAVAPMLAGAALAGLLSASPAWP